MLIIIKTNSDHLHIMSINIFDFFFFLKYFLLQKFKDGGLAGFHINKFILYLNAHVTQYLVTPTLSITSSQILKSSFFCASHHTLSINVFTVDSSLFFRAKAVINYCFFFFLIFQQFVYFSNLLLIKFTRITAHSMVTIPRLFTH